MNKILKIVCVNTICVLLLAGCSSKDNVASRVSNGNAVDAVLQKGVNKSSEISTEKQATEIIVETSEVTTEDQRDDRAIEESVKTESKADIDMTEMSSDMIYATVYQLMSDPDSYVGKTIRLKGNYYATWYEPSSQYFHYALILDATDCCAQGLEFIWEDGSHVYPDEYPKENTEIIVTGIFETYREDGDPNLYCRLSNSQVTEGRGN